MFTGLGLGHVTLLQQVSQTWNYINIGTCVDNKYGQTLFNSIASVWHK
jgi:hypothetical protein